MRIYTLNLEVIVIVIIPKPGENVTWNLSRSS
jgi:hypothetical protein